MTRVLLSSIAIIALASSLFGQDPNLADHYRDTANKLIDAALIDHDGLDQLSYLCDRIGNRRIARPRKSHRLGSRADEGRRLGQCRHTAGEGAALGTRRGERRSA